MSLIDTYGNGTLEYSEFSDFSWKEIINEVDENGDGEVFLFYNFIYNRFCIRNSWK